MEEEPIRNRRRVSFVQEKVNVKGVEDDSTLLMEERKKRLYLPF